MRGQEACKGTVAAAVRVDYLRCALIVAVLHIVQLEAARYGRNAERWFRSRR